MSKIITRRSLLVSGIASLICEQAIVKAASIMPVKSLPEEIMLNFDGEIWPRVDLIQRYVFRWIEKEDGWCGGFVELAA